MSKYTARVKVRFTVEYVLAIPTDKPDPSDREILDKICSKDIFTEFGWSSTSGSDARFGLNEMILEQEGIEVEGYEYYSDPEATGNEYTRRDWEITIDENEGEQQ